MTAKAELEQAPSPIERLADDLERKLIREYGICLSGVALSRSLGYRSIGTMRQAIKHHAVPVPLFPIKDRRGKYALAGDVARWLAAQRATVGLPDTNSQGAEGGDSA